MRELVLRSVAVSVGDKFNRWTVTGVPRFIRESGPSRNGETWTATRWLIPSRCDCGTERFVRAEVLIKGLSKSCGCLARELTRQRNLEKSQSWNRNCGWCGDSFLARHPLTERCMPCRTNPPSCVVSGCPRKRKTRDWCGAHYEQIRSGHEPFLTSRLFTPEQWLFVNRSISESGCWEWTGNIRDGYGVAHLVDGDLKSGIHSERNVHRIAYILWKGVISPGNQVHHVCANRLCFNPDHLQLVTQRENIAEMQERKAYRTEIAILKARIIELESLK